MSLTTNQAACVENSASPLAQLLNLESRIEIADIGAACITEIPVYRPLIDQKIAHLHAFEGDERQVRKITETYRDHVTVHPDFLYDGSTQTVYFAHEASGMTSLLKPNPDSLKFFNGFEDFGRIFKSTPIQTKKMDEVPDLPPIDFLKMDVQGAELIVLKNAKTVLSRCVAIQLEVSFITLYEGQPTFGEIDVWMRSNGFVPHCFLDVKRWSIAPTIKNNNFREPFNQLLEADVVYIRDPLKLARLDIEQLKKLAIIAQLCVASTDLAVHMILEIERRSPRLINTASLSERFLQLLRGNR